MCRDVVEYRPAEDRWDDIEQIVTQLEDEISLFPNSGYDNNVVILCFACMENARCGGSFYCLSCGYKRNRRLNVSV